jgi:hypothetical protein
MAKSSLEKMKDRLKKSTPKISGRANLENMNQIKNFVFGKSKSMGIDDDAKGISIQKAKKKISDSKTKKPITKKDTRLSPGALGGKIKTATKGKVDIGLSEALRKKNKKITPIVKKDKKKIVKTVPKTDSKSKVKATAGNTKDFAKTMAMQKKLIAKGAKIKADGIMGPKTRAAMAKYMKPMDKPKSRPSKTMVDSFKKSNVSANKNKKAGIDGAPSDNTKQKSFKKNTNPKLDSKGNYKGTNIKPTKLQLDRMNKRRAKKGST